MQQPSLASAVSSLSNERLWHQQAGRGVLLQTGTCSSTCCCGGRLAAAETATPHCRSSRCGRSSRQRSTPELQASATQRWAGQHALPRPSRDFAHQVLTCVLPCLQTFGNMVPQAVTDKLAHRPLAQVALRCERWCKSASVAGCPGLGSLGFDCLRWGKSVSVAAVAVCRPIVCAGASPPVWPAVQDWAAWGPTVCAGAWKGQRGRLLVLSQRLRQREAVLALEVWPPRQEWWWL